MKRNLLQLKGWANVLLNQVPLVLMTLLTIASFIVLKQAPSYDAKVIDAPLSHNSDYFLRQFVTTEFMATGALRAVVQGAQGSHSPATKTLTVNQIAFSTISNEANFVGSANQGVMIDSTEQLTLRSQVVINKRLKNTASGTESNTHFEGEHLVLRTNPDSVTSNSPVRIQSGGNTTTADSLQYDKTPDLLQLKGRVKLRVEKQ